MTVKTTLENNYQQNIPSEHVSPNKPSRQVHLAMPFSFWHVPLSQGFGLHGSVKSKIKGIANNENISINNNKFINLSLKYHQFKK